MPLSPDIIDSVTIIEAASPALPGFGIPIIGVQLTGPQIAAWDAVFPGGELIAAVTQSTWQAVLTSLAFADGDPLWEELETGFSADLVPELVLIGREAVPVAQVVNFLLDGGAGAAADGNYTITINGTAFTHAAAAQTRAQVIAALEILIDAGSEPVTADDSGGTPEDIDVTSSQPGIPFSFAASAPVGESWTIAQTTANVGLTTDLAAWEAERSDWYFVTELSRDPLTNTSMAGPVAAHPRDIVFGSQVDATTDPNATTDTSSRAASDITTSQRTFIAFVPTATDHDLAAHYFRLLPTDPGEFTWTSVELRPIDGDTYTALQTRALRGLDTDKGRYWYYEALPTRSFGVSRNARMGDGTRFEDVRDRDHVNNQIVVNVSNAIIDANKIPYTDDGAAQITGVIRGVGRQAEVDGIIAPNTFTIRTATRAEQEAADISAGIWRGWVWEATLAGSIGAAVIRGTLFIV